VYAQGTGLGEAGPWAGKPAQDTIGMAHAGFLSALSRDGENPSYISGSLSDIISGTCLAMGVLAALRVRDATGEAQYVSASQLQAMLWTQMMNVTLGANLGVIPKPVDRTNVFNPLFNLYRAGDSRWFTLNALQPRAAWPVFCRVVGREELIEDPRFSGIRARSDNRRELIGLLDELFATRPRDEWLELLSGAGLWVGQVNSPAQLAADEQVRANGYLSTTDDGVTSPRAPFRIAGIAEPPPAGAPPLSRDSEAILHGVLGLTEEAVLQLKADGVVW
jgi:crotonobetainyl-CoA:carnitine CoA-transferase CaiB-like acyl-CoA transferase